MQTLSVQNFQKSFNEIIHIAKKEPIEVSADDGTVFVFQIKKEFCEQKSPLDVEGVKTKKQLCMADLMNAVEESRNR